MISKKTKYGLHSLIYLAKRYNEGPVLIANLAREERIPKKFLEAILLQLKKQGILESKKGKGGGYSLSRPPDEIDMGRVVRILDGPLAPVACVSKTSYRKCGECQDEISCGIRMVMTDVRDAIANILDKTSLADVIRKIENKNMEMAANYQI